MQTIHSNSKAFSVSNALYARLTAVYPSKFKLAFKNEMMQVFDDKSRSVFHQKGWLGVSTFWLLTIFDTLKTAFLEHIEELFQMKYNPKNITTSALAFIGGLLTIFIVVSNWADLPYPFPSSFSFGGTYWTFNIVSEDNLELRNFFENYQSNIQYTNSYPFLSNHFPINFFEDVMGEAPIIPEGQKPSYPADHLTNVAPNFYRINNDFSAYYSDSDWGPDMVRGTMSIWETHSSPYTLLLPLLWLGILILLMAYSKPGKLGNFGLSIGIVGCITMLFTLGEFFRTNIVPSISTSNYLWLFFSYGSILMGLGLILFGFGTTRHKVFSKWNALPIGMGAAQIAMEVIGRIYALTDLVLWPRVQGILLLFIGLSWIILGLQAFKFNKLELSPA